MHTTVVRGRFIREDNGLPQEGRISFVPSRLWVRGEDGKDYATYSVNDLPLVDGVFEVELTPSSENFPFPLSYKVICPIGEWTVTIPDSPEKIVLLRDLLPTRFRA